MIEVRNIKKSFNGNVILNDVSAKMEGGKCNLIIGASGNTVSIPKMMMTALFRPRYLSYV